MLRIWRVPKDVMTKLACTRGGPFLEELLVTSLTTSPRFSCPACQLDCSSIRYLTRQHASYQTMLQVSKECRNLFFATWPGQRSHRIPFLSLPRPEPEKLFSSAIGRYHYPVAMLKKSAREDLRKQLATLTMVPNIPSKRGLASSRCSDLPKALVPRAEGLC